MCRSVTPFYLFDQPKESLPGPEISYRLGGDAERVKLHLASRAERRLGMNTHFDGFWQFQREGTYKAPLYAVQAVVHAEDIALARQSQEAFWGFEQLIITVIRPRVGYD